MNKKNFYEILESSPEDTQEEIKKSYERKISQATGKERQIIEEAFNTLGNGSKRQRYDLNLSSASNENNKAIQEKSSIKSNDSTSYTIETIRENYYESEPIDPLYHYTSQSNENNYSSGFRPNASNEAKNYTYKSENYNFTINHQYLSKEEKIVLKYHQKTGIPFPYLRAFYNFCISSGLREWEISNFIDSFNESRIKFNSGENFKSLILKDMLDAGVKKKEESLIVFKRVLRFFYFLDRSEQEIRVFNRDYLFFQGEHNWFFFFSRPYSELIYFLE